MTKIIPLKDVEWMTTEDIIGEFNILSYGKQKKYDEYKKKKWISYEAYKNLTKHNNDFKKVCPKCGEDMERIQFGIEHIYHCNRCKGKPISKS